MAKINESIYKTNKIQEKVYIFLKKRPYTGLFMHITGYFL